MGRATIPATLIAGDGIGPEIMAAVCQVLEARRAHDDRAHPGAEGAEAQREVGPVHVGPGEIVRKVAAQGLPSPS